MPRISSITMLRRTLLVFHGALDIILEIQVHGTGTISFIVTSCLVDTYFASYNCVTEQRCSKWKVSDRRA